MVKPVLQLLCILYSCAFALAQSPQAPRISRDAGERTGSASRTYFFGSTIYLSVAFISSTPVTVRWFHNARLLRQLDNVTARTASLEIPSAAANHAGTYWAEVSNADGIAQSSWTAVSVVPAAAPVLLVGPAGSALGYRQPLSVTAEGYALTYQWFRNGAVIEGATTSTIQPADYGAGDYKVVIRNAGGEVTSSVARVHDIPFPAPLIAEHPRSATAYAGQPWVNALMYTVLNYGQIGETTIEWSKDGGSYTSADPSLAGKVATPAHAGEYRMRVRRGDTTLISEPARLTVLPARPAPPPIIRAHPASLTARASDPRGSFLVTLDEQTAAASLQWRKDGVPIPGATSRSYTVPATGTLESHVGTYDVVASNSVGSTTSRAAVFEIAASTPGSDVISRHPASQQARVGTYAAMEFTIGGGYPNSTANGWPRITWRHNGATINSEYNITTSFIGGTATLTFYSVAESHYGIYTATVELENGTSTTSRPAELEDSERNEAPAFVMYPAAVTVERGMFAQFTSIVRGERPYSFQWLKDGTPLPNATTPQLLVDKTDLSSAGRYSLKVTNRVGSVESPPVALTLQPAQAPIIERHPPSYIRVSGSSFFYLTVTSRRDHTYQWYKDSVPIAGETDNTLGIDGRNTNPAGRYRVVVSNIAGQSTTSDETLIVVDPAPQPPFHAIIPEGPITQSGGTSLTLASILKTPDVGSASDDPSFPRFQWLLDGVPIPGATGAAYFVPSATSQNSGEYTVSRDDGNGPIVSVPVRVAIDGSSANAALPFVYSVNTPASEFIGLLQPLRLGVSITSSTALTYEWYRDGTRLPQYTGPELSLAQLRRADAGTYSLIVRNGTGAIHALSWRVQATVPNTAPIIVEALPGKIELLPGQSIVISAAFESPESPQYFWTKNGQAITGSNSALTLSYATTPGPLNAAGTYALTLRNRYGSTSAGTVVVSVATATSGGIFAGTSDILFSRREQSQSGTLVYIGENNVGHALILGPLGGWAENLAFAEGQARAQFPSLPGSSTGTSRQEYTLSTQVDRLTLRLSSATTGGSTITRVLSGTTLAHAGYYKGALEGASSEDVRAIITPDGIVGIGVFHEELFYTAYARFTVGSEITVSQYNIASTATLLNVTVNAVGPQITGSIVTPAGTRKTFSATRLYGPLGSRLSNVSSRGFVGSSDRAMIAGFSLAGAGERRVLIRGIGPTLASFGVSAAVPDTALTLFQGSNRLAQNDNWSNGTDSADIASAATASGAFALVNGSRDAALLRALGQGSYTAQVSETANREGIALAELYVLGGQADGPAVSNLSIRGHAASGEDALIAGLAVNGAIPRRLLIRAVGPTLSSFNVTGAMADPRLRIYHGDSLVAQNDNWAGGTTLSTAASTVGAFALPASSRDAALIIDLPPGTYTAQVDGGPSGDTGIVLLEAYVLP